MQKSIAFLYTSNEQVESDFYNTTYMKYLGVNLIKYTENLYEETIKL